MKCDLVPAMKLGRENLINCLDKDHNMLPFWELNVDETYHASYRLRWPAHNLGRWIDAMLRLEESLGMEVPPLEEAAMLENLVRFLDNEDHLCIEPDGVTAEPTPLDAHSMREALLALSSLISKRNSVWARRAAQELIKTTDRLVGDDGLFDLTKTEYYRIHGKCKTCDPTQSTGRFLDALVPYVELTGDPLGFHLAEKLAVWHYEHSTTAEGTLPEHEIIKHTHSYLGMLRGLLQFGRMTGQQRYIERVRMTYLNTVRKIVKQSGYTCHDMGFEGTAETTSPGDAAQIGLWLGLAGYPEFLDDAERIVRARLLPSQITETPPLIPNGEGEDRYTDLEKRLVGAFGGMMYHPHGRKKPVTDITSAVLHTLTDIYNHIVVENETLVRVLFHFCYAAKDISVDSKRENGKAFLRIENRSEKHLEVRIPGWVTMESLQVTVNGCTVQPRICDGFLRVEKEGGPVLVEICYDLPEKVIVDPVNGVDYTIAFRGDEIVGVEPNTEFYPLYGKIDAKVKDE